MHDHKYEYIHSTYGTGRARFFDVFIAIIEPIGSWWTNSTAIMADAAYGLGDSMPNGLAWILNRLCKRKSDWVFRSRYQRFSLLGALIKELFLMVGSLWS